MDLVKDPLDKLFFRYLASSFGSVIIVSIYSMFDAAVVGRYHGPAGAGAVAVVMPIWSTIFCIGTLIGVGGSVLWCRERGARPDSPRRADAFFTSSVWSASILSLCLYAFIILADASLLRFFGADGEVFDIAMTYLQPIKYVCPLFLLSQMLAPFVRADGAPGTVAASVLIGGVLNMFFDWYLAFEMDMGARGAGIASAGGAVVTFLVIASHFARRSRTLRVIRMRPFEISMRALWVCRVGFPAFVSDSAAGVLNIIMNRQVIAWIGMDALAVYGALSNISVFAGCCAVSVGHAAQPIISANAGAGAAHRVRGAIKSSFAAAVLVGIFWCGLSEATPLSYVRIFMTPSEGVLEIASPIIRAFAICFIAMPINILASYSLQSLMQSGEALVISLARGVLLPAALIFALPPLFGPSAIWWAVPASEILIALWSIRLIRREIART